MHARGRKIRGGTIAWAMLCLLGAAGCRSEGEKDLTNRGKELGESRKFAVTDGMLVDFAWLPRGEFQMGEGDAAKEVKITRGFWMARTEVTRALWIQVMGSDPSEFEFRADRPVERVSWNDCQAFLAKLKAAPSGWRYELPTEAQWEYAAQLAAEPEESFRLWNRESSASQPRAVALLSPNRLGIFDLNGNVSEWCRDVYQSELPGGENPLVKGSGSVREFRVIRGGSWATTGVLPRSDRNSDTPALRINRVGFRLVMVRETEEDPQG